MTAIEQLKKDNEELTEACEVWLDRYEELQSINEWKPIITAPEDEHILVFDDYVKISRCRKFDDEVLWVGSVRPTHWMPLPKPPKG